MKIRNILIFVVLLLLVRCGESVGELNGKEVLDFSDPKTVIETYFTLTGNGEYEESFRYVDESVKEYCSEEEYYDYFKVNDSLFKAGFFKWELIEVEELKNEGFKNFRSYCVNFMNVQEGVENEAQTYMSVHNTNGEWKYVFILPILKEAEELADNLEYKEAIKKVESAIEYDPLSGMAYEKLAWYQMRLHDFDNAKANADSARAKSPTDYEVFNCLGAIYSKSGNHDKAIYYYRLGLECPLTDSSMLYSNMAITYESMGETPKEKSLLMKSLRIKEVGHNWYVLGSVYEKEQNFDSALICFEKSVELGSNDNVVRKELLFSCAKLQYEKALIVTDFDLKNEYLNSARTNLKEALTIGNELEEEINLLNRIYDELEKILIVR